MTLFSAALSACQRAGVSDGKRERERNRKEGERKREKKKREKERVCGRDVG